MSPWRGRDSRGYCEATRSGAEKSRQIIHPEFGAGAAAAGRDMIALTSAAPGFELIFIGGGTADFALDDGDIPVFSFKNLVRGSNSHAQGYSVGVSFLPSK